MTGLLILVAIAVLAVPITAFLCAVGDNLAEKWRRKRTEPSFPNS